MQTQDYGAMIDKLADKLAVPAAHLWGVLIRQARIDAIRDSFWAVVLLLIVFVGGPYLYRRLQVLVEKDPYAPVEVGYIIGGLGAVFCFVMACVAASSALTGFLNPEFAAVNYILSAAR